MTVTGSQIQLIHLKMKLKNQPLTMNKVQTLVPHLLRVNLTLALQTQTLRTLKQKMTAQVQNIHLRLIVKSYSVNSENVKPIPLGFEIDLALKQ